MNTASALAIDRIVGVPICGLLSLYHRLFGRPAVVRKPRSILVILLSEMGSLVLAQPMFALLRKRYPEATVHVLLFARNREVLDLLGVVDPANVHTVNDRSALGFITDTPRVLWRLRALRLDAVLDCELFSRVSSIYSYLTGAPLRVGFHRHTQEGLYRGSFVNRPVLYNPYRHLTWQLISMVSALESTGFPLTKQAADLEPEQAPLLQFAPGELQAVHARLEADFPVLAGHSLVLVFPSGGMLPIRAWPLESFAELCRGLLADGHAIGVLGLPEDRELAQALVQACGSPLCVDLAGYTRSIRHLLALYCRARLLVSNDGGPGHFAALTPVPTIMFFGPETPVLYRSLSPNACYFHVPLPCSPCVTAYNHRVTPCDGDNQCLKQLPAPRVLARAREMLQAGPSSAADAQGGGA